MCSPDLNSAGFLDAAPSPLRYGAVDTNADPIESFGRLKALMPCDARVLDVGCGAGGGTLAMNEGKRNVVVCVEPDPERAEAARRRGLDCRTALFDAETASLLGKFDVIVFADVLEHLAGPAATLSLARSLLNEGGYVLVSVPNVAHWSIRVKLLFGRFDYQEFGLMDATHLRWFTHKTLGLMLQRSGFSVSVKSGSAGSWLHCYKLVPWRRHVIGALQKIIPSVFSCQLVFKAQKAA